MRELWIFEIKWWENKIISFNNEITYTLQNDLECLDHLPQIHIIKDNKLFKSYSKYTCSVSWTLAADYDVIAENEDDADEQCRIMDLSDFHAEYVEDSFEIEVKWLIYQMSIYYL